MFSNIKLFAGILTFLFVISYNSHLRAQSYTPIQDTTSQSLENSFRFGLFYSPFNTMIFGNDHEKRNNMTSLFNLGGTFDYYLSDDLYLNLRLGYNYYFQPDEFYNPITDVEFINHHYSQITINNKYKSVYFGIGIGLSYTYHVREYEYEKYQYIPLEQESVYIGNEYYFFEQRNTSLDIVLNFGVELFDLLQVGMNMEIAVLNLRDQEKDFSHKATVGFVIGFKIPEYRDKKKAIYKSAY